MALTFNSTPERGEIRGRIFNDAEEAFFSVRGRSDGPDEDNPYRVLEPSRRSGSLPEPCHDHMCGCRDRPPARATTRRTRNCRVGIMGMGRIGALAASSLAAPGFDVADFSRSGHLIEGFQIYGADDLDSFLARTDILICLLPLTDSTRHILTF